VYIFYILKAKAFRESSLASVLLIRGMRRKTTCKARGLEQGTGELLLVGVYLKREANKTSAYRAV